MDTKDSEVQATENTPKNTDKMTDSTAIETSKAIKENTQAIKANTQAIKDVKDIVGEALIEAGNKLVDSKFNYWTEHLRDCSVCQEAIKGRLAGVKPCDIIKKCCDLGKPLYRSFVHQIDEIWDETHQPA